MFARLLIWLGVIAPPEVFAHSALAPGPVQAVGTLLCEAPVRSPIHGRACAAYFYRASAVGSGRASSGARMRPLRRATVFAPELALSLEGGAVPLVTPRSDSFDARSHELLQAQDLAGFRAVENTLRPGQRVRVRGKVVFDGKAVGALHARAIEALEPPSESARPARSRKPTKPGRRRRR